WEEAHHLYAQTLQFWQWSGDLDIEVARARKEGAWQALMPWAQQADMENAEFWRSGRIEARLEALVHLGRRSEAEALRAEAVRAEASRRPEQSLRARFENGIELTGVTLPAAGRRGQQLLVRFGWRATRRVPEDYTVFVHLDSPGRRLIQDHVLGGGFGTSQWAPGERTVETLPLAIAEDATPGVYRVRVGLWQPSSRRRMGVVETDLPHDRVGVITGTVTVVE